MQKFHNTGFLHFNFQDRIMSAILFLQIILLFAVIYVMLTIVAFSIYNGISPMPSSRKALSSILHLIKETSPDGNIIDLGSGWGTLCFAVAKAFPKKEVHGYENSPAPYMFCLLIKVLLKRKNLHFTFRNFHEISLHEAGLVLCYLYSGAMTKLKLKLELELRPGTMVISNTFAMPIWKPKKVVELKDLYRTKIYLYTANKTDMHSVKP
jgi:hypothetical protein